jgi:hypothetical protein
MSAISAAVIAASVAATGGLSVVGAAPATAQSGPCAVVSVLTGRIVGATVPAHSSITVRLVGQNGNDTEQTDVVVDNPTDTIRSTEITMDAELYAEGWRFVSATVISQQCAVG